MRCATSQNTLTSEEWLEVDDLARETLAQRMVAVLLHKALNDNSNIPLADFIVEAHGTQPAAANWMSW